MKHTAVMNMCKFSMFLFSLCTNLLAPLILPIGKDFSLSLKDSGMMFFIFYAGSFLGCALGSKLTSCFGKRAVLIFCLTMMSTLCLLIAATPAFPVLCCELFCLGFSTLLVQIQSSAIPPELSTDGSASSLSTVQAFSALGACAGLLWSGLVVTLGINWRMAYLLFGILTAAAAILCFSIRFPKLSRDKSSGFKQTIQLIKNKTFLPVLICLLLYAGAEAAICSWLVTFLVRERSFSTLEGSITTGIIWLSIFLGRLICSHLVKRFSKRIILLSILPMVFLAIMMIPWAHGIFIWICAVILGFGLSGIWPLFASKLMDTSSHDGSVVLSVIYLFCFFGNAFIPYIIGIIADFCSLAVAITIDGSIFAVVFLIFWQIRKRY